MKQKKKTYKPIPTLRTQDECEAWLNRHDKRPRDVFRGDVWFANLGSHAYSSVQEGKRPVLIISNNTNNCHSNIVTVVPFTSVIKHTDQPTHVMVGTDTGWESNYTSMALAEQVTTIDKRRLIRKLGQITDEALLKKINRAVQIQMGMEG